jgi:hypothetical protein
VYSFEAKIGKGAEVQGERLWNAHMHALVFSAAPLPVVPGVGRDGKSRVYWPELSRQWREKTGDSFIVECHPVRTRCTDGAGTEKESWEAVASDGGPSGGEVSHTSDGLLAAVCEVSKYAVKLSDSGPADAVESWAALRGRRLCGSFGSFYGVEVEKEDSDCDLRQLAAFIEYVYCFDRRGSGYSVHSYRVQPGGDPRQLVSESAVAVA